MDPGSSYPLKKSVLDLAFNFLFQLMHSDEILWLVFDRWQLPTGTHPEMKAKKSVEHDAMFKCIAETTDQLREEPHLLG